MFPHLYQRLLFILFASSFPLTLLGEEVKSKEMEEVADVATQLAGISSAEFLKMVDNAQKSVVVVETDGRDGKPLGIGSGFVISEDGLIATNLHVIGEARPIRVKLFDDREFAVTEILGTDKTQDVALIRIEADGLTPLKLGPANSLKQGQPIFALGNPWGLEHSVVTGVVSGFRDNDDGMSLIQLAIPIERGNSGGPLLDMRGNVHGLLTLKSQVTENLGYAVKASAVQALIASPNPIPMSRWMTIGTLNPKLWEPRGNVNWKHRAGVISVDGTSRGFGGRALCLSKQIPPEGAFEFAVDVKIEEEDGAAGLVFHSDGGDQHFGFYPSSGLLRLTRFDGPTVYSWKVLKDVRSSFYRPGEWNRLKVRITDDLLQCYCNDELVIEHEDPKLIGGRIGIVKFRHTTAQFKRFQFAEELPSEKASKETLALAAKLGNNLEHRHPPTRDVIKEYSALDVSGRKALHEQARILEQRAEHLRELAREIHEQQIREELVTVLSPKDEQPVNLLRACLLVSALDNPEIDIESYEELFEQFVEELTATFPENEDSKEASTIQKIAALKEFMFETHGFHGSRTNYYHASNSYINEAIDDREGLPLTLSILFVELARRVGIDAAGIGLPGHFIARVTVEPDKFLYIDAFEDGQEMTVRECKQKVRDFSGFPWNPDYLDPQSADVIVQRMLRNLIRVANNKQDLPAALRYVKTIIALSPDSTEDRLYKAVLCFSTNRLEEALEGVEEVLAEAPEGIELQRVRELRQAIIEKQELIQ